MLPSSRVRALLGLVGEVREIVSSGADPVAHIAEGVTRLVDGDAGGLILGPSTTELVRLVPYGFSESTARQATGLYVTEGDVATDPVAARLAQMNQPQSVNVALRRDVVDDDAWYGSDFVNAYRRAWRLDDSIYGNSIADDGSVVAFACFRAWGARPFTCEDRALAELLFEQCVGAIAGRKPFALSKRQREVLRLLLDGHRAKVIAARLNLSIHTVNEYIQALYRATGVCSRSELMAIALKGLPRV